MYSTFLLKIEIPGGGGHHFSKLLVANSNGRPSRRTPKPFLVFPPPGLFFLATQFPPRRGQVRTAAFAELVSPPHGGGRRRGHTVAHDGHLSSPCHALLVHAATTRPC